MKNNVNERSYASSLVTPIRPEDCYTQFIQSGHDYCLKKNTLLIPDTQSDHDYCCLKKNTLLISDTQSDHDYCLSRPEKSETQSDQDYCLLVTQSDPDYCLPVADNISQIPKSHSDHDYCLSVAEETLQIPEIHVNTFAVLESQLDHNYCKKTESQCIQLERNDVLLLEDQNQVVLEPVINSTLAGAAM